ncbi:MAG: COG4223 family protein [Stellaceae bacterium]
MTEQQNDAGPEQAPDWIRQGPQTIDAAPAAAAPKRRRARWLWPALLLTVVVAAAIASASYWTSLLPWAAPGERIDAALGQIDQRLAELAQRQAALEQRLAGIEQRIAGAASAGTQQEQAAALRHLADRLAALEQRAPDGADPTQLTALADSAGKLAAGLAELGARIDALEAHGAETTGSRDDAALLLALGQLRNALESGRPFAAELATVRTLTQSRPELREAVDALSGAAATGVASLGALTQRFTQEVAPALLRAPTPPESEGITDRVLARLRSLVVIHRIGDARDPVESAVEHAEAALSSNDLAGAVAALAALPATEAAPAQGWLAASRQRLAASETLDRLDSRASARVTTPAAPAH